METLLQNEQFMNGISTGVNICLQMLLAAHERGEPLMIDSKPYYILDAEQLLQQMLDSVCR